MKILTPSQMRSHIEFAFRCDPPEIPYAAGPPAIGKSDLYKSVAKQFNLKLLTEYLSQKPPEDLTGMPRINTETGKSEYVPFGNIPLVGDPLPLDADGEEMDGWLLFFDELADAPDEVWSAIYPALLDHTIGGHKIHPNVLIGAAGNREDDSALARRLPDTLITRMLCREMKESHKDWLVWAEDFPKNNERVIEFVRKNPSLMLSKLKAEDRGELQPYESPRGWGKAMNIVNTHERITKASTTDLGICLSEEAVDSLQAALGDFASRAFIEFYDDSTRLPAPYDIVAQPSTIPVPPTAIGRAKICNDLVDYYVKQKKQPAARDAIIQYMNRMPDDIINAFFVRLQEDLGNTPTDIEMLLAVKKSLGVTLVA